MWQRASRAALAAAFFLVSIANALPHGDDDAMDMDMSHSESTQESHTDDDNDSLMSYFAYGKHSGAIVAHIGLMILAWCFILPTAVMFSVARSRFALPSQFLFLVFNAVGLLVGIIYNSQTPGLYPNNAHHKIGWIVTWVMSAQVIMSLIFAYAGRGESESSSYERAAFLPVSTDEMAENAHTYPAGIRHSYRWSRDSGQGTERNSSSLHSRPSSPSCSSPSDEYDGFEKPEDPIPEHSSQPRGWFRVPFFDRFLASRVPRMVSNRGLGIISIIYSFIDRIILPFGFVALTTGGVTYGGLMRGSEVFNGLAHFIKGGIFFWYGILTLGRMLGCWADLGWAWNVKPSSAIVGKWKAKIPSGEFVESFVIFLYGITNVFLEHLAGWGGAWTATDLEHVSISIMFFGGGLCGMLFESKRVRGWLNSTVLQYPSHMSAHTSTDTAWQLPDTQGVSLNPMPALIILLLGMMMGSHHQTSMVSTMVHKQWGNLLVGFALARGMTYVVMYLKPPTSYLPSRPPTEIVAAFCLMSGGLVFMLSTRSVIDLLEEYDLDAMFVFTVTMGLTAFIMACEILCIAIKAWAVKRESRPALPPFQFPASA
ncbi:integral membrane protein [Aspergillus sclerotioniger CBS 115572]|uniref:Integral membrane protein n=1 Tax=Aspergillus sclerotioniger CBS 115572 TaxID=1450535 RepID=A0A317XD17_9EURO|nr:integral membrane protein [Aspergillus sclerotioniger CBS 115572]PWY94430.1 integral membrane protein [Aspergillus sclerotioniger CBS 115572]